MGIEQNVATAIVREHAWRPITGDVLLFGRQTMFFTPEDAKCILNKVGLPIPSVSFTPDERTRQASSYYISDADFFRLLGVEKIRALDVSDYEGADIVHDLTVPIPDDLEGIADFILDGSTLDNVFDPATVLRNAARLLKPNGRLLSVNVASNTYGPYIIPTAHMLLDYFVVNGFKDCKVYIFVYGGPNGGINVFAPDLRKLRKGLPQPNNFTSPYTMAIVVMAEKGQFSTWDQSPVQHQYRSNWDHYLKHLAVIEGSNRPEIAWSTMPCFYDNTEFLFVDEKGFKCKASVNMRQASVPTPVSPIPARVLARELGNRVWNRVLGSFAR